MSNVAIFIPTLKSGGAEKQACLLAKMLSNEHNVIVIVCASCDCVSDKNRDILNSISTLHVCYLPYGTIKIARELYKTFREHRIDTLFNFLTYPDIVGAFVAKIVGVKRIYNGIRSSRLPFYKYVMELVAHNFIVTKTIFNSYSGAEYFNNKWFSKSKSIVIHNCFDGSIVKQKQTADNNAVQIISVGRFSSEKDYGTALYAIKNVLKYCKNIKYIIVGYGSCEAEIRALVTYLHLDNNVDIIINPNNILQLLSESDIYLSTSLFEGTSNSIMEALSVGLPVVATRVGDNDYLVELNRNGFLHDVKNPIPLSNSLQMLIVDDELRHRFGENSLLVLQEKFSSERFVSEYSKLIFKS